MRPNDEFTNANIQAFLEAYPDAIAIHRDGTLLYVNRAGLELIGATEPADVVGRSIIDFVHPDSRDDVLRRINDSADGQPGDLLGEQFVTLNGAPIEVEVVSLPIDLQRGRATQLIIRNVTEIRRVEAENRRLEQEAARALQGHRFTQEALDLAEAAAGLGVWDWTVGATDLRWTKGLEPLHGMEPGTFNGTFDHFIEAVYAEDRPGLLATIEGTLASGEEFEVRFRLASDASRWILGKGRVYREADGTPVRMVGIGLDITDRTRVELALAESENLFRLVTSLMPANVAYIDDSEVIRFANETFRTWYGIDPDTVVGQTAREFWRGAYETLAPALHGALQGESSELEVEIPPVNGRRNIHARFEPDFGPWGRVNGVVALFNDVTAQRDEAAALEARSRCQGLLSVLGVAIQQENDAGELARLATGLVVERWARTATIEYVSGNVVERIAFTTRETDGTTSELIPMPASADRPQQIPAVQRFTVNTPGEGDRNGLRLWLPLEDDCIAILTVLDPEPGWAPDEDELMLEIGERLRGAFERAALFRRLQLALSARDDFIGFTTHELKTPLTVVLGFADILARRVGELPPEEVSDMARTVLAEARRLEGIVENMLHLARAERGTEDEPTLLHRVAETVFGARHWLDPERPKRLTIDGQPGMVMAPSGWIEHLVENLLSNAEKYSETGAPIDVEVSGDHASVTLRVLDRGRGISDEQATTLFEPFFRANPTEPGVPGIGLGLTVCRKLVDRLEGEIWLRPRTGGGTEAGFKLPVVSTLD